MAADDDAALAQNMGAAAGIGPSTAIRLPAAAVHKRF